MSRGSRRRGRMHKGKSACARCGAAMPLQGLCGCQGTPVTIREGLLPMRPWPIAERARAWNG